MCEPGFAYAPLYKAIKAYIDSNPARFHTPGHKGRLPAPFNAVSAWDVTEVGGMDSLYEASGPISEMEREYSALYGTAGSFLSAGGATLCIQAMLSLAAKPGDAVICGRGVHTSAINAMALLGLRPFWVYPEIRENGLTGAIPPGDIEAALSKNPNAAAVYITSPSYYGALCDIESIAGLCRSFGIPLLVDNAHGAHLKFLSKSLHPMDLGASMCTDSLHKTLPVLTGGAMLHIASGEYAAEAKKKMSMFGSTSPSYLVMLSCDMALGYLKSDAWEDIRRVTGEFSRLYNIAARQGFSLPDGSYDPFRLTLGFAETGYTREEFGAYLRGSGVEPEYLGWSFCVFLGGAFSLASDFAALERAISALPKKKAVPRDAVPVPKPEAVMELRDAVFAPSRRIPVEESLGKIASGAVAPCPPGIPVVVPGEKIGADIISLLKSYGILYADVVK